MRDIWISKAIYGKPEIDAVNKVLKSEWLGTGEYTKKFEQEMASFIGVNHGIFVNSGSSALMLALKALDLPPGSEVITCAAGFPSTLNPIIHLGYKPVLVDCDENYNIDPKEVKKAISENTSAIVFAHAAGFPVNMDELADVLEEYPSIEDACDALGATYAGKDIGSFGTISCFSFYASHHITAAGGGGMALTDDDDLMTKMFSLRDWGKKYDKPGYYQRNNSIYDTLTGGVFYDRSYSYDTVGFNLKMNEMSAAFGYEQMKRLPKFIEARRRNYQAITEIDPEGASPFFVVMEDVRRNHFANYLESHGIRTRPFFAGNVLRHPALKGSGARVVGELPNANRVMRTGLMIGCHPGLSVEDVQYIKQVIESYDTQLGNDNNR